MTETVRFGLPFNGVVPLWHEGTTITWHRPGTDLTDVLGMGLLRTQDGPASSGRWQEKVEVATLENDGSLRLHAATPTGRRAVKDAGAGALVPLSRSLSVQEVMATSLNEHAFAVYLGRLMLRAARDGAILLFTLRAPEDPEAHHLLSVPSELDENQVMHFHLGTLMEMRTRTWRKAVRRDGMTFLDLEGPYQRILAPGSLSGPADEMLDGIALASMARPVTQCVLRPGFPFALGMSVMLPR